MPPTHPAARAGAYAGWTVPLDYQPVHELLRRLRLPPYDRPAPFTLEEAIARYWQALVSGVAALLVMALLTTRVTRLNQRLARAKARLEQQQELILNSVAEGIYGVDLSGRTTFVNRPLLELTGWRAEELIGASQHDILHHTHADGRQHPADDCPVYATFRDNQPRFIDDDVFWRKDGTSFPVEYSSTPIRDDQGLTTGTVVVFRDVTERKQAEERVREHQAELAHVARLSTLGEMASGIAHELNQPLTAIATNARACVRMLEGGRNSREQCSDVMERISAQAERAGEVIRQIRRFVRKEPPEMRATSLATMLDTVTGLLRRDAQLAGIQLIVEQPPGPVWVHAQEIQIEQVLLNLARNAIEAMTGRDAPKRLTLAARPDRPGAHRAQRERHRPRLAPGHRRERVPAVRHQQAPRTGTWALDQCRHRRDPRLGAARRDRSRRRDHLPLHPTLGIPGCPSQSLSPRCSSSTTTARSGRPSSC